MASATLTDKAFTGKTFTGKADFRRSLRQTLLIINALLPMTVGLGGVRPQKQKRAGMARPFLRQSRTPYRL